MQTTKEKRTGAAAVAGPEPAWLAGLRARAGARFDAMQWPTPNDEEWRRTDIGTLDVAQYRLIAPGAAAPAAAAECPAGFAGVLRFRGGALVQAALKPDMAARGVHFEGLTAVHNGLAGAVEPVLSAALERADNRLIAWHYQHLTHGALLHVPRFVEIEEPFLIEFEEVGDGALSMPHVTVVLDSGARAVISTRIASGASDRLLCNAGVEIVVGDAAHLRYFEEQELSGTSTYFNHGVAQVGSDAELLHFVASLGSNLAKSRLDCTIAGRGANVNLNGVYFAAGKQHMDLRTVQHHKAGNSTSRSFYKGAVKDSARTIYQGLIEVMPTAPKTDAYLTNRNLILNDGARADSIPGLRINQDDVRCSHGSTTGRIDAGQLFYLQTRGLDVHEASRMLVTAYFQELVDQIPQFLHERVLASLEQRV
jgi:Fe-S cluster assembly protein SufD